MNNTSPVVKCLLCCIRCCVYCLDCCIKYISENAFVHVAMNGTPFCESATSAFWI